MVDVRLPGPLRAALDQMPAQGRETARRAAGLSAAYRTMQPSATTVVEAADVGAYLATRLPATFAATATVLGEAARRLPEFAPRSMLDAGAGPGTASWAAVELFPNLGTITMLDHGAAMLATAGELAAHSPLATLNRAERVAGSLVRPPFGDRRFDLVVASYALTELADARVGEAALALWGRCDGALVLVEPGRPRDYQRLMAVRAALVAAGARIAAPCPHERPCPLPEGDWCHFSVRLPRSRAHMQAKGATLGYEDEKFSYLVVARQAVVVAPPGGRLVRPPLVRKFEAVLPLCTAAGLEDRVVRRRDAAAFKAARNLEWGDAVD
ncbi:MAG: small ribosomal subunit Rsm22 family protein [Devosia sp.]|nr:small ribosomal subunit Rsm22 family protein [Devosia sp.]